MPRNDSDPDADEDEEDPRDALVRRLLEHEKFKAAAELLHERETIRSAQWTRPDARVEDLADEPFERDLEVDLFSGRVLTFSALHKIWEQFPVTCPTISAFRRFVRPLCDPACPWTAARAFLGFRLNLAPGSAETGATHAFAPCLRQLP